MPPKYKRQAEAQELEGVREEREGSASSEATVGAESVASCLTVTSDHLERILRANQQSMADLIAALPLTSSPSSSSSRPTYIKPPK